MRKIFLTITAVVISAVVYAQTDSTTNRMNQNNIIKSGQNINSTPPHDINQQSTDKSKSDGYIMQNGKVMMSKNGQMTAMEKEMTFNDGSVLRNDGTIIRKDGTKLMVKDGEYVDLTGTVVRTDKNKDIHAVPDSKNNK